MVVLWGINTTIVSALVSRDPANVYTAPALAALAAPLGAEAAMALCATALPGVPWIPALIASAAVYAAAFFAIERLFAPGDFAFYSSVARFCRG